MKAYLAARLHTLQDADATSCFVLADGASEILDGLRLGDVGSCPTYNVRAIDTAYYPVISKEMEIAVVPLLSLGDVDATLSKKEQQDVLVRALLERFADMRMKLVDWIGLGFSPAFIDVVTKTRVRHGGTMIDEVLNALVTEAVVQAYILGVRGA